MKKTGVFWIVVGSLIVTGCVLALIGMCMIDFDFHRLEINHPDQDGVYESMHEEYLLKQLEGENVTYTDTELSSDQDNSTMHQIPAIKGLDITTDRCDISVQPSADNNIRVVISHIGSQKYNLRMNKDGILQITQGEQEFFDIIGAQHEMIIVDLPAGEYESLNLHSTSGDINVQAAYTFDTIEVETVSGEAEVQAKGRERIKIHTTSGDISLLTADLASQQTAVELSSSSGEIGLNRVKAASVKLHTTSGKVRIHDTDSVILNIETASGDVCFANSDFGDMQVSGTSSKIQIQETNAETLNIKTVSGNVGFADSDFGEMLLTTTSGDISGSLNTPKEFKVDTTSGRIHLPNSIDGSGLCQIHTTSGDVEITVNK